MLLYELSTCFVQVLLLLGLLFASSNGPEELSVFIAFGFDLCTFISFPVYFHPIVSREIDLVFSHVGHFTWLLFYYHLFSILFILFFISFVYLPHESLLCVVCLVYRSSLCSHFIQCSSFVKRIFGVELFCLPYPFCTSLFLKVKNLHRLLSGVGPTPAIPQELYHQMTTNGSQPCSFIMGMQSHPHVCFVKCYMVCF